MHSYRVTYSDGSSYLIATSSNISLSERVLDMLANRSCCVGLNVASIKNLTWGDISAQNGLASVCGDVDGLPKPHFFVNGGDETIALNMLLKQLDSIKHSKCISIAEIPLVNKIPDGEFPWNGDDPLPNIMNIETSAKQQEAFLKNTLVYRVMRLDYFLEWCDSGQNTLVSVERWDDPWERALFRNHVSLGEGRFLNVNDFEFYGQCWSYEEKESDATWRLFAAANCPCVRIGAKAWDLYECLSTEVGKELSVHTCFAGSVKYMDDDEIINFFSRKGFAERLNSSDSSLAETLFVKRNAFSHEREFRIIYFNVKNNSLVEDVIDKPSFCGEPAPILKIQNDFVKFDFPVSEIQSVLIGPQISHCPCELEKRKIDCDRLITRLHRLGVRCDISISNIYDYPIDVHAEYGIVRNQI